MKETSEPSNAIMEEDSVQSDYKTSSTNGLNTYENKKSMSFKFLLFFCVLTIMGSVFGIVRGAWYQLFSDIWYDPDDLFNADYYRGWLYIISGIGTLVGAFIMVINRKITGLYVYTVFQILYIVIIILAVSSYTDITFLGDTRELAFFISMFFLIPSVLFLILYWLTPIRKHLV